MRRPEATLTKDSLSLSPPVLAGVPSVFAPDRCFAPTLLLLHFLFPFPRFPPPFQFDHIPL